MGDLPARRGPNISCPTCRAREAAILAADACQQFAALLWSTGNLGQGGRLPTPLPAVVPTPSPGELQRQPELP
jgi:hypothetical protein